jgi:hypothetical protein
MNRDIFFIIVVHTVRHKYYIVSFINIFDRKNISQLAFTYFVKVFIPDSTNKSAYINGESYSMVFNRIDINFWVFWCFDLIKLLLKKKLISFIIFVVVAIFIIGLIKFFKVFNKNLFCSNQNIFLIFNRLILIKFIILYHSYRISSPSNSNFFFGFIYVHANSC